MRIRPSIGQTLVAALAAAALWLGMPSNCTCLQAAEPDPSPNPNLRLEVIPWQTSILECEPLVIRVRLTNRGKEPIIVGADLKEFDSDNQVDVTIVGGDSVVRINSGGELIECYIGPRRETKISPQESQERILELSASAGPCFAVAGEHVINARFRTKAGVLTATTLVKVAAPTGDDAVVRREIQEGDLAPYLGLDGPYVFRNRLENPDKERTPVKQDVERAMRICKAHPTSKYSPYLLSSLIDLAHMERSGWTKKLPHKLLSADEGEQIMKLGSSQFKLVPHARTTLAMATALVTQDDPGVLICDDVAEVKRLLLLSSALKPDPEVARMIGWYMKRLSPTPTQQGLEMP